MNKRYLTCAIFISVVFAFSAFTHGTDSTLKSGGGPPYNTNAPGDKTCSGVEGTNSCHSGGIADNAGPSIVSISFSGGNRYVPGQWYTVTANINHLTRNRFGFQIVSLINSNNLNAGLVKLTDTVRTRAQIPTWGTGQDRNYVMHVLKGSYGTANASQWSYSWQAPATDVGPITFYACFLAANNNNTNDPGDETYFSQLVISPTALGIAEHTAATENVFVYPNPTQGLVHLEYTLSGSSSVHADLMDMQGKCVQVLMQEKQAVGPQKQLLHLDGSLPKGLYFIHLTVDGKPAGEKMVVLQ
jgi:hypothetical protein